MTFFITLFPLNIFSPVMRRVLNVGRSSLAVLFVQGALWLAASHAVISRCAGCNINHPGIIINSPHPPHTYTYHNPSPHSPFFCIVPHSHLIIPTCSNPTSRPYIFNFLQWSISSCFFEILNGVWNMVLVFLLIRLCLLSLSTSILPTYWNWRDIGQGLWEYIWQGFLPGLCPKIVILYISR